MGLLEALFSPRRVALVGASDKPGSVGQLLAGNLASFPGEVVPVRAGESLADLDPVPELAIVAVPAAAVPRVAADAAAAGVEVMVVLSGGFAEVGPEGHALQEEVLRAASSASGHRVRVVGPNCFGVQNCDLPLNASIARGLPLGGGGISVISQSGAYGMAVFDLGHDERVAFAKVCAPGNTSDVSVAELLASLGDDPATRTICLLLESLADGRGLVDAARRITPHTPVLALKTGRSADGARAAQSHTAALASSAAVWQGAFHQAGIVEVRSGQELLDAARAIDGQPLPRGDRVAIITNSGGTGVELADLLADEGLTVPRLSEALQERVRALLPAYASPVNPVDITTAWSIFPIAYPGLVDLLARSGEVDAIVTVLLQRSATDGATVDGIIEAVRQLRADACPVPVFACWVAPRSAHENAQRLQESGVPVLPWPGRMARALARAREVARVQERPAPTPGDHELPLPALPPAAQLASDPIALAAALRSRGIDVVPAVECSTVDEAAAAATRLPAVVKVARAAHRSDTGGVRLGLTDAEAVRSAAADLLSRGGTVLVSPQLEGIEVAVGAFRDASFGPVVMVGLGGIWVEALDDVAFAPAPLTRGQALDLLRGLRALPLLTGGRGGEPVDLEALAGVVAAAGDLLVSLPDAESLDLNPVLAGPGGVVAVDWKLSMIDLPL